MPGKIISEFLDHLKYVKRYSENTVKAYRSDLKQLESYILHSQPGIELRELNQKHIKSFLFNLVNSGYSSSATNRKISSIKSFYKFLHRKGKVDGNPAAGIKLNKRPKRLPGFIEEEGMDNLLSKVFFPLTLSGMRDKTILCLLYGTGIRRSELINARLDDLDLHRKSLKVLGKGKKERVLPLPAFVIQHLTEFMAFRDEEDIQSQYLIPGKDGEPVYPKLIYRSVNKYLSKVSTQKKKSPHILRHSFATHLMNNGADLNAVKELLGHTNLAATQVYTHNSFEKLKETYKKAHPKA